MITITRIIKAPEERKAELIEVATKLFFENGYRDTTVRDIIAAINGSQGMFYHYFNSKDDIYRAALDHYITTYIDELHTIFYNDNVTIPQKLVLLLTKVKQTFNRSVEVMSQSDSAEDLQFILELKSRIVQGIVDPIQHIIEQLMELNMVDKENIANQDTHTAAVYIAHGIYGIMNMNLEMGEKCPKQDENMKMMLFYSLSVIGVQNKEILLNQLQ